MSAFIWLIFFCVSSSSFFFFCFANCVMRKRVYFEQLLKTNTQQMMNETKLHFLKTKKKISYLKRETKSRLCRRKRSNTNKLIISNILVISFRSQASSSDRRIFAALRFTKLMCMNIMAVYCLFVRSFVVVGVVVVSVWSHSKSRICRLLAI